MPYLVALGGANKQLRMVLQALACDGHGVTVMAPVWGGSVAQTSDELTISVMQNLGLTDDSWQETGIEGVRVLCPRTLGDLYQNLGRLPEADVILVPTEDPAQALMTRVREMNRDAMVVAIAQTPATLPFGPCATSAERTPLKSLVTADRFVVNSRFLGEYVARFSPIVPRVVRLQRPLRVRRLPVRDDASDVLIVNASKPKGSDIFIGLARALAHRRFSAVPGWGTSPAILGALRALPNVEVCPPALDIVELLARTRLLIVPSVWLENVPLIISEALACGVPVLASNVGGIPDLLADGGALLGIKPMVDYRQTEFGISGSVPAQPLDCWARSVEALLSDQRDLEMARQRALDRAVRALDEFDDLVAAIQ